MDSPTKSSESVVSVNVHAAKDLIDSGLRYLDVRTVEEFNRGHVNNSLNVPYVFFTQEGRVKNPQFIEQVSVIIDKDERLLVGCQSGARSTLACKDLLAVGYNNVHNVGGGFASWVENGFAVRKPGEEESQTPNTKIADAIVTVNVHAAKDLLAHGHRYLDVRTEEEFRKGHVENALNVPYMLNTTEGRMKNPQFVEQVSSFCKKDDLIVVGCNSGGRSLRASLELLKADFKNVINMGGGYAAWVDNGFAPVDPEVDLHTACAWHPK